MLFACGLFSLSLLAKGALEYLTSHEGDIIRELRGAEGLLGDKIDEKESDQDVSAFETRGGLIPDS